MMTGKAKVFGHRRPSSDAMNSLQMSKSESVRDCSFSDSSSGYLSALDQTDSEDAGRMPQVAVVAGSYPNLSPMIIMNNVVLKQTNSPAPTVKPWGFQPALEMPPQPQVVFLQPVVSGGSGASPKRAPDKLRRSRKYLPILKSYPKIAPHPGESTSEKSGSSSSSEWSSSASGHTGRHRRRHRRDKQLGCAIGAPQLAKLPLPVSLSSRPASPKHSHVLHDGATATDLRDESALVQSSTSPPAPLSPRRRVPEGDHQCDGDGEACYPPFTDGHNKRKRFCNTYNILHKSGLLGITLRTKELIRQNRRTQGQLERLREQTSLFLEAVHSGDPQVWTRLQLTMLEAGPAETEEERGEAQDCA